MTTDAEASTNPLSKNALNPSYEIDRFIDRAFPETWLRSLRPAWTNWEALPEFNNARAPKVNISDEGASLILRAEVPGVDKKDLDISVSDSSVTIRGTTRRDTKKDDSDYYCREFSSASFIRSMTLPCAVDPNKTKATLSDGVLELLLPKVAKTTSRNVTVD